MSVGDQIKKLLTSLKSFDVWDESHDRSSLPLRIPVVIARFLHITFREFVEDRLFLKGMALTFATLLSIVPLLVISFSVFKLFGGGEWFEKVVHPFILTNLAPGSGPIVAQKLQQVIDKAGSVTLGGIGVILLLLAVYGLFAGIETTFDGIWGVKARHRGFRRLPLYWGLVTIIPILVIGSLALSGYIQALPLVQNAVERISFTRILLSKFMPSLMVMLGFFLLYRYLPNTRIRNRAAMTGALIAGVLYEIVKFGFIIYTGKLVRYDVVYGSLAALPMLLIWINLSWFVVLLGVEVCFVVQHFSVLVSKSKQLPFSRWQKDALAYLILTEATKAFRGMRSSVTLYEWSNLYGVPPGITEEVVERLCKGKVVERTGITGEEILLALDPDRISLKEIENIMGDELGMEWKWPDNDPWNWLKTWITERREASRNAAECRTLGELVRRLENNEAGS